MFMQFRAFVQSSIFKIEITVHISQNFMIDLSLQSQGFVNLLFLEIGRAIQIVELHLQ